MHESVKLAEARYFLSRMLAEHDNPSNFRFETSAFLAAARSILYYAQKEAWRKPAGRNWYDRALAHDSVLKFLRDVRDANIHTAPVIPATSFTTRVSEYLRVDEDTIIPFQHYTSDIRHRFKNWPGDEEVIELSQRYLDALQTLVDDGISQGMITG